MKPSRRLMNNLIALLPCRFIGLATTAIRVNVGHFLLASLLCWASIISLTHPFFHLNQTDSHSFHVVTDHDAPPSPPPIDSPFADSSLCFDCVVISVFHHGLNTVVASFGAPTVVGLRWDQSNGSSDLLSQPSARPFARAPPAFHLTVS